MSPASAIARPVIGVDFDNTVISYDRLLHSMALEQGLIAKQTPVLKKAVRDQVRLLQGGDLLWQDLQAYIYGPGIGRAQSVPGVGRFFRACARAGWPVYIISHKTRYAGRDATGTDLRLAALSWMDSQGFFNGRGLGLGRRDVFFRPTRAQKVACIRELGCTHFIDDLEETFWEKGFAPGLRKILFAPGGAADPPPGVEQASSWEGIYELVFGTARG